ncbi:SGNH/GDSL hydrolase family protein [Paraburkholderia sp. CNPSo 3076]|uniref:SGNH/GDSL hydrolase family protein n=1 Tax=Paraburkholderia sp. CNPSo 3076 TaxID=2940936 RepID=UPI00224DC189|nr:SGNH/GDSL hydrolase family protein [Paraburkholderia sp. CNPSo 3076]MCX5539935.1 SGNH/GDSL hydrolase family protein [Paraburkholderia sp. CNPSo 3076]
MSRSRRVLLVVLFGALSVTGLFVRLAVPGLFRRAPVAVANASEPPSGRVRLAVLGDSDSQSYHDTLMLGDPHARGGQWRATTWQWTEVLAQLRGDQIDQGKWGAWGTGKYRAIASEALGALARTPPKQDYRYNFAIGGATCGQLMGQSQRQAIRLVDLMDTEPQAWRGGIVFIRIGDNDLSSHELFDELSRDPTASHPSAVIDACIKSIGEAVALIRKYHPDTYVVLSTTASAADWPGEFESWQSAREIANIDSGIDRFNNGLRALTAADRHVYVLEDEAWFRSMWGQRDDRGRPNYKTVHLSPGWAITNTSGDDPHNVFLSDSHAGVVWNTLWTQYFVTSLNAAFGLHIKPITDAEIVDFLRPSFRAADPTSVTSQEAVK